MTALKGKERNALIQLIMDKYTGGAERNGRPATRWTDAFNEHPEWKQQLGVFDSKSLTRVQAVGRYLNLRSGKTPLPPSEQARRGIKFHNGKGSVYTRTKKIAVEESAAAVAPEPLIEASYCPNCGFNLQMLNTAMRIAHKHRKS